MSAGYHIRKGGYFYRPNAQGYTSNEAEAGVFTFEEAVRHAHPNGPDGPRDGISYHAIKPTPTTEPRVTSELVERLLAWKSQVFDYSAGEYPIVPLAKEAAAHIEKLETALAEARAAIISSPETANFMAGVPIEAAHQRERWGAAHDAGKSPFDWFWLIGYLTQKAADAATRGDLTKAQHHTISTAAALANWHAALTGADTAMRPGISAEAQAAANGNGKIARAFMERSGKL